MEIIKELWKIDLHFRNPGKTICSFSYYIKKDTENDWKFINNEFPTFVNNIILLSKFQRT